MNKYLLLTCVTFSGSILTQAPQSSGLTVYNAKLESYVLPIGHITGVIDIIDWTNQEPTTRQIQVIQQDADQKRCIRVVSNRLNFVVSDEKAPYYQRMLTGKYTTIEDLPVEEATKTMIAQKLQRIPQGFVEYSKCDSSVYDQFAFQMAKQMSARASNKQSVEKAQLRSNIISEVPVQEIHNDVCETASKSLDDMRSRHYLSLRDRDKKEMCYKQWKRWTNAHSVDVVYTAEDV